MQARDITVDGIVQGVGFRPFVARLAREMGLAGWVSNATDGVHIHIEAPRDDARSAGEKGARELLDEFARRLEEEAPAAARIVSLEVRDAACDARGTSAARFEIRPSDSDGMRSTLVSPDLATCDACLAELDDPADRRYRYPFINCTNCGPRFTIIEDLPYDRPVTSMRRFEMCPECAGEYADENDRRYHAQPDACFECGPRLWWLDGESTGGSGSADGSVRAGGDGESLSVKLDEDGALELERGHITREESDEIISRAARELAGGHIVAVKGLGGWHLACDATSEEAVRRLRDRKRRPTKPLAIMVADVDMAKSLARVGDEEERLLTGPERPIVLLERREMGTDGSAGGHAYEGSGAEGDSVRNSTNSPAAGDLAPSVADPLPEIGVMLPATPLEHLLLAEVDRPLVMTSGNVSGEPIVSTDAEALSKLADIADGYLGNNRAIVARYDDSVERVLADGTVQLVRRARGMAPTPLVPARRRPAAEDPAVTTNKTEFLPHVSGGGELTGGGEPTGGGTPVIFAAGPEQKATIAWSVPAAAPDPEAPEAPGAPPDQLASPARIHLSQHLGDLETLGAWSAWEEARVRYERLFALEPAAIACDMHPEYLSGKWARERAADKGLPLIEVQHHHAHIASVLGEHGIDGPVIGIALDGTGYGDDGTIWGGEVLIASRESYRRFWHLPAFRLPGGETAIRRPARTAQALLCDWDELPPMLVDAAAQVADGSRELLGDDEGRIVHAMLEADVNSPVCTSAGRLFDAAAALLGVCTEPGYDGEAACLLEAAARNRDAHTHEEALAFHDWLVGEVVGACESARDETGIRTIAASGGCMCNRLIAAGLKRELEGRGFELLVNRELPPNDGCIAYGQAIVAAARCS